MASSGTALWPVVGLHSGPVVRLHLVPVVGLHSVPVVGLHSEPVVGLHLVPVVGLHSGLYSAQCAVHYSAVKCTTVQSCA